MIDKALALIGLVRKSRFVEMERSFKKADGVAKAILEDGEAKNAIIVADDYCNVSGIELRDGKRIVVYGAHYVSIRDCIAW